MRSLFVVLLLVACERKEARPKPAPGKAAVLIHGHPITPVTWLAATRGGSAIYVKASTKPRTCEQLFTSDGSILLTRDEVLVHLELGQPLLEDGWQVMHASWPGGNDGAHAEATVTLPENLAAQGGTLGLVYHGKFDMGAGSPRVTLDLDGSFAVKSCGDRPWKPLAAVQPVELRRGKRQFPIRGARLLLDEGKREVALSSLAIPCPKHHSHESGGDVTIDITVDDAGASTHVFVAGDLLPVQQNYQPGKYKVVPPFGWDGDGPIELAIDGDGDDGLAIHGRVTAERCPPDD